MVPTHVALLLALFACVAIVTTAAAQPSPTLFDSKEVLSLRIAADFGALMRERDSTKLKLHAGRLTYATADGQSFAMPVNLRLRGHWRRQRRNCDFAPIKVDFPRGARRGSLFENQGELRLVTHCRSRDADFDEYVLREYMVYQLVNVLTPITLRARLARATYVDTVRRDSVTRNAFFVENESRAASRNGAVVLEATGATWPDVDPNVAALVSAFEYMIGGTDWSLTALHNIILFEEKGSGVVWPMAYDFDWTGIVSTKYSFPDPRLGIRRVGQRLYRGVCRRAGEWQPILAKFVNRREAFNAAIDSVPGLDPKFVRETRKYLDEFFATIQDPSAVKREFVDACRPG
jgi:hypothetical protein